MQYYTPPEPVLLRKTEDWASFTPESYRVHVQKKFSYFSIKRLELFLRNLDAWDSTFSIPYVAFRRRLTQIARKSWEATKLRIVTDYDSKMPPLFPTDDDDWLHPDIRREALPEFSDPSVAIVTWDCYSCFTNHKHVNYEGQQYQAKFVKSVVGRNIPGSNGFAIRSNVPKDITYDHGRVKQSCLKRGRIQYISKPLSVWVLSPGSLYMMSNERLDPNDLGLLPKEEIPAHLSWAKPYHDELFDVCRELNEKRRD